MKEALISLAAASAPLLILMLIRLLLDLEIAWVLVKRLSWIPVRSWFRLKIVDLEGEWMQHWQIQNSSNFPESTDRHSSAKIWQLGVYCYAEFHSGGRKYVIFGRVKNAYITGTWHDKSDDIGYYGAFQLWIRDSRSLSGTWLGFSKTRVEVVSHAWEWAKLSQ